MLNSADKCIKKNNIENFHSTKNELGNLVVRDAKIKGDNLSNFDFNGFITTKTDKEYLLNLTGVGESLGE